MSLNSDVTHVLDSGSPEGRLARKVLSFDTICPSSPALLPEGEGGRCFSPLYAGGASGDAAVGRVKLTVVPSPTALSAQIRPPWASTMHLEM